MSVSFFSGCLDQSTLVDLAVETAPKWSHRLIDAFQHPTVGQQQSETQSDALPAVPVLLSRIYRVSTITTVLLPTREERLYGVYNVVTN